MRLWWRRGGRRRYFCSFLGCNRNYLPLFIHYKLDKYLTLNTFFFGFLRIPEIFSNILLKRLDPTRVFCHFIGLEINQGFTRLFLYGFCLQLSTGKQIVVLCAAGYGNKKYSCHRYGQQEFKFC